MRGFEKRFDIEGLRYRVVVSDNGQVAFLLDGGSTPRGVVHKDELFDDIPVLNDVDLLSVHPMTLFRIVAQHVEDWIWQEKPYQFFFSTGDVRRATIYRWLARRAARRLSTYWYYEMEGTFHFFLRAAGAPDHPIDQSASRTRLSGPHSNVVANRLVIARDNEQSPEFCQ
ncbi:hypothetical protein [Salinisphaera aquimarina]|uniref:Uncharacterized protein n=1 Tax=Salinisphaera aquimarina TaxID=2094031 RepID=A0ABV7EQH6_9GAMM